MNENGSLSKNESSFRTAENVNVIPKIKILNKPLNNHSNHPINKLIK